MKMPNVMRRSSRFARVPTADIPRSVFDRSHALKTTFDAGWLVPVFIDEALPGDTFNLRMNAFARLSTPLKPLMDNLYLDTFFFAVPYRHVWDNWEKFNGAQEDPGDSTDYTIPVCTVPSGGYDIGTFEDHAGLPTGQDGFTHSALWRRAYFQIYNEWFRDENIINSLNYGTGDGPDTPASGGTPLRKRGKRHDYFTSCLPWAQKGTVAAAAALSGVLPVDPDSTGIPHFIGASSGGHGLSPIGPDTGGAAVQPMRLGYGGTGSWTAGESLMWDSGNIGLEVDLSAAIGIEVNTLRQSFQIQKMLERDARGGTRYIEIIKSHFGVTSPDARLQRSEYLGGGTSPILLSPIAQTSNNTNDNDPQGNLAAIGTGTINGNGFVKSFTEHCLLIGLVSARADLTYQQGMDRMWSRSTRYDFYWPTLAHIGEQAVLNKEIYCRGDANDDLVFGYQERYAEYRYKPSKITGLFRSEAPSGSLEIWHASQEFTSLPTLNKSFIEEDPPIDRLIATPTEPHFIMDSWFQLKCARPMPVHSVPGLIDHF